MFPSVVRRLGGTRPGLWAVKHVVSPLDGWLYRHTGSATSGGRMGAILLLTTVGRRTRKPRTTPMFYLEDEDKLVVCNVRPAAERRNPWVLNAIANPEVGVQVGRRHGRYRARPATPREATRYWPRLVAVWPAYQSLLDAGGDRTIFVLEPDSLTRAAAPPL